jgi:hypothetical protein
MKTLLLATVVLAGFAGSAIAAPADGTFLGRTSQGYKTRVVLKSGQVQVVRVPWGTSHCKPHDGYTIKFRHFVYTNTPDGPIEQPAKLGHFHDSGRVIEKGAHSRIVVDAKLTGHFVDDNRVEGTQRIRVRTHDKFGRHRCTTKMTWFATR